MKKMNNICRICMKNSKALKDINSNIGDNNIGKMLEYSIVVTITDDVRYPRRICASCVKKINTCYKFKKKFEQTDRILREYYLDNLLSIETRVGAEIKSEYDGIGIKEEGEGTEARLKEELDADSANECGDDGQFDGDENGVDINKLEVDAESLPLDLPKSITRKSSKGKPFKTFNCTLCAAQLTGRKNWIKHLKLHPDYQPFLCSFCAKGFRSEHALNVHVRAHTGSRPFQCEMCSKAFRQKGCLLIHVRALHTKEKPFECDKCCSRFARKEALVIHTRTHDNVRPFVCGQCGKRFGQQANLKTHVKLHTGERPYACELCTFTTAYSSALKKHRRGHTNEKNYVCAECGKAFRDNTGLWRHKRLHSGELPYKCQHCPRAFIDSWKRSRHILSAHPAVLPTRDNSKADAVSATIVNS